MVCADLRHTQRPCLSELTGWKLIDFDDYSEDPRGTGLSPHYLGSASLSHRSRRGSPGLFTLGLTRELALPIHSLNPSL